jgi:heme/copper-type cytochrome/quinol oxidase subunit 4
MKKKYLIELIIAILILVVELIFFMVMYPEAQNAQIPDVYMTAIFTLFTNIFVVYGVILIILNSNWRE